MIGLRELSLPGVGSWEAAEAQFALPRIDGYNIAADCLRGGAVNDTALIVVDDAGTSRVSYQELDLASFRLAAGLRSLGLEPGDRVAIKLSQSVDMAVAVLAVLRSGAIVVPVSNVLGRDGVLHRLGDSDPRLIIAGGSDEEHELATEAGIGLVATADRPGAITMEGLIAAAPARSGGFESTGPDTPALLLYTSGTTGKSKGVLHGHRVLLGHHSIDFALNHVRHDDVAYSPVDWAWAGGLFLGLLVPMAHGIPVVAFREPRFDPEQHLRLLADCGVSVGLYPPTVLRLLRQSGLVGSAATARLRLRCLVTGAEAVEPELFGWAAEDLGVTVNNAYGQTEANALVGHSSVLGDLDPTCLGRPYPGRRIAVLDERFDPVAIDQPGQLVVAADDPVAMLRYWNDPEATARKVIGGWLPTGDTMHVDAAGQLFYHGRSDDIIKSGGYRIGPAEVEAALLLHPAVAECAVVGLPDPVRGQAITAFVRLRERPDDDDALITALQQEVRGKVGAHAYPRSIRFVDDLPQTSTGKVSRAALRSTYGDDCAPEAVR